MKYVKSKRKKNNQLSFISVLCLSYFFKSLLYFFTFIEILTICLNMLDFVDRDNKTN